MKKLTLAITLALIIAPSAFANGLSDAALTGNNAGLNYTQGANSMTINCPTVTTNVEWQKLNVGANEALNFNFARANSTVYNTVVGGSVSTIAGKINAIGAGADTSNIVLTNPSGVTFANGAVLNVGQFTVRALGGPVNINSINVEKGTLSIHNPGGDTNVTGNIYVGKNFNIDGSRTTVNGVSTPIASNDVNIENAVINVPNGSFNIGLAKNVNINNSKINAKEDSMIWSWGGTTNIANSSVKLSDGTVRLVTTTAKLKNTDLEIGRNSTVRNIYMQDSNLKAKDTEVIHSIRLGYNPDSAEYLKNDSSTLKISDSNVNIIELQSKNNKADISSTDINSHLYSVSGGDVKVSNNTGHNILRLINYNGNLQVSDAEVFGLDVQNSNIDLSNINTTHANVQLPTSLIGQNIALETSNGTIIKNNATNTDIQALDSEIANMIANGKITKASLRILPQTVNNTVASASGANTSAASSNMNNATTVVDTLKVNTNNYNMNNNTNTNSIANQFLKNVKSLAVDDNENEKKKQAKLKKLSNGFRIEEKVVPIEKQ
ncbi:MAG: filamentous hemagglutinin N-terminal domain-containing protein [Candidatus Gastranaerophilaceae bacterium]